MVYTITDDTLQFTSRKGYQSKEVPGETLGNHSTLGAAVKKIVRHEVGSFRKTVTIQQYAEHVDSVYQSILEQFPERPSGFTKSVMPEKKKRVHKENKSEPLPSNQEDVKEDFEF